MQPGVLTIDGGRARARVPSTIYEHDGFRAWARSESVPDDLRIAFVGGEVMIDMSPESTESHSKPKLKISGVIDRIVDGEDLGECYPDRVLLTHVEAELSTEPDFVFASWAAFESGRLRLVEKAGRENDYVELEGTPDLVVEVVSDSSVRKDTQLLRSAYHRAGIAELWLIDARDEVSFQILRRTDADYALDTPDGQPQHSRVLGRTFQLRRERNRLGRWRYDLDVL